jgi:hypothetical protein
VRDLREDSLFPVWANAADAYGTCYDDQQTDCRNGPAKGSIPF